MAEHNALGQKGESIALEYLRTKGYEICHTNWRFGRYELDIVAKIGDEIVFIEVKTRRNMDFLNPEDAVDTNKVKNMLRAGDNYIKRYDIDLEPRFDIISIVIGGEAKAKIKHIEDAFISPIF